MGGFLLTVFIREYIYHTVVSKFCEQKLNGFISTIPLFRGMIHREKIAMIQCNDNDQSWSILKNML